MFSQSRYISYLLSVSCLLSPPGFCYRHWSTGRVLKASERNVPDIEIHRVQCCMQKVTRWGISEGLRFFLEPLSLSQLLTYIKHCIAALPIDIALHSLRSWSTLLPLYGLPSLPHPHCLQWLPDLEKTSDEIGWINMDQLYVFFSSTSSTFDEAFSEVWLETPDPNISILPSEETQIEIHDFFCEKLSESWTPCNFVSSHPTAATPG